jgi:MinD superfamily P-loop ATPase
LKEILVISGKGGTGKTSLVACFASLAPKALLADCDVDAADLYLVLDPRLQSSEDFFGGKKARIITENCTNCGICFDLCRFDAVLKSNHAGNPDSSEYNIDTIGCEGCGVCAHFCPDDAIVLEQPKCGELYLSETRFGPFVHAKLGIAAENSGKLVANVRKLARETAQKRSADYIIIDGPPGIGCPVISSITGVDIVVIVTEPTVSGLSDLKRVESLSKHFGVPATVCINKYDINAAVTKEIIEYCENNQITVLGRIPYDIAFTKAQIQGVSILEYAQGDLPERVIQIWESLLKVIRERIGAAK